MATWEQLGAAVERFPQFKWIIGMPGILDVLVRAMEEGWPPDKMENHLRETEYWKNTTDRARQWDLLRATDQKTAQFQWDRGYREVLDTAKRLGVKLTKGQLDMVATAAVRDGWDNDTLITTMLGVNDGGKLPVGGDFGAAVTQVRALADDYGVRSSNRTLMDQATALLTGGADAAGMADFYRGQAVNRYGHNKPLVDALNRGVTVKQYADPYIQLAVDELGVNPATIRMTDPKWGKFLSDVDEKGQGMTVQDWQRTIRNDQSYGYNQTAGAADQASQLVSALAESFGAK